MNPNRRRVLKRGAAVVTGIAAAFASLPLQFTNAAVRELEYALTKLGMRGAAIGGSVNGTDFSDPQFHPVWAKDEELGTTLFIHPQSTPEQAKRFKGNGWLFNVIGNPLDTTIALQRLIFDGTLDKFPGLKICAAHGGGFLGSYAPRMDHSCLVSPRNCDPRIVLKKKPTGETPSLSAADRAAILGDNARRMLNQPA